jgi:hypothetical protein
MCPGKQRDKQRTDEVRQVEYSPIFSAHGIPSPHSVIEWVSKV